MRVARALLILASGFLILAACASTRAVSLEGPNGQTAECRPPFYHLGFFLSERTYETDAELLQKCIADYERRGFRQVPPG